MLVNECSTQEINIQKGLKQGDPLAPFLFLLVVKGFSASIRKTEELREFTGFQVGSSGLKVLHLQYVDDTLFIGEASMANLWTMNFFL